MKSISFSCLFALLQCVATAQFAGGDKSPVTIADSIPPINPVSAAPDTIRLNFLYGSVPAIGHKKSEPKWFGGLKGGHVNIEAKGRVLDFKPFGNCPIVPNQKKPTGGFVINRNVHWDTSSTKWISISIPVTSAQMRELDSLFDNYSQKTPYDYAVFGMRCAAASYDVLSDIGLMKPLSNKNNIINHFYPKLLRKKMLKWAQKNNYPIRYHEGRSTRKWENDEGLF
jgi:hypothetical protein